MRIAIVIDDHESRLRDISGVVVRQLNLQVIPGWEVVRRRNGDDCRGELEDRRGCYRAGLRGRRAGASTGICLAVLRGTTIGEGGNIPILHRALNRCARGNERVLEPACCRRGGRRIIGVDLHAEAVVRYQRLRDIHRNREAFNRVALVGKKIIRKALQCGRIADIAQATTVDTNLSSQTA